MNTKEMLDIALKLAELDHVPEDTEILVPGENIRKIAFGVDMDTPEILVAQQLGCDCVVSHHPRNSTADGFRIMEDQIGRMRTFGVPLNVAQKAIQKKMNSMNFMFHGSNSERAASAARLLNMPFMCIHTPCDLIGESLLQTYLDERFLEHPEARLKDLVASLSEFREYRDYIKPPVIRVGDGNSFVGRIAVLFAGGTGGGTDVYKAYFDYGVGTLVVMGISEAECEELKTHNKGNVVVAGHMSSDSLGINRLIEAWRAKGAEVITMCGIV